MISIKTYSTACIAVLFCSVLNGQVKSTIKKEKSEPFSYFKNSVEQLGFKDAPEAMAVTNGSVFSSTFLAVEFFYSNSLKPIENRVITLEKGKLPIIHHQIEKQRIQYKLEAFSAPLDFNPKNNLITYIKWTIKNNSNFSNTTKLGIQLRSLYNEGFNEFLKHNRYCTPWYQNKYLNEETFDKSHDIINFKNQIVLQGNHTVLLLPNDFKKKGDGTMIETSILLNPNEKREFIFKMPFVPIALNHVSTIQKIKNKSYDSIKKAVVGFWDKELESLSIFTVPEKKVMNTYTTSYVNLLTSRDILENSDDFIQKCNEFQYDHFYVRDNAYFTRIYDMLGLHEDSKTCLQPYFIYDIENKPIHFRQRTGIYNKLCHDYWGQVLWALGSHYRQNKDREFLKKVYKLLPNHLLDFKNEIASDDRGLWPKTWPYDNEHIDGHYTGHSFWVILGLRYAILMAKDMEDKKKVIEWTILLEDYTSNFKKQLKELTDKTEGYIPPGMDNPEDGYDWANASAGLYPFEALDKENPIVKATLETVRKYNFMEGISTYSGANAWVIKKKILSNDSVPKRGLHHYETFYVTSGNLILGEQKKVIEDLYAILVHTSSTNAGFEWHPTPWSNRNFGMNRTPHGWMGARYIELLRNMLVREEKQDLHLFSAISPYWTQKGESIVVKNAPTYMGQVSYTASFGEKEMRVTLNNQLNETLENLYFHIPWFIQPTQILIDGVSYSNKSTKKIKLVKNTKKIIITWNNEIKQDLNYQKAVALYLDKYYNHPATENYVNLFPTLVAPRVLKQDKKHLILYSPGHIGTIHYTVNGETPTINSLKYNKKIRLDEITKLKAIAIDKNGNSSDCLVLEFPKK
ncbi:FN3 associated domain-containing protein [Flavicella sp.]|uniref:FN3 associated domain-containing protein n=1 Tax=Flavicella sp. TaxID=2957742 RepID=UPI00301B41C2